MTDPKEVTRAKKVMTNAFAASFGAGKKGNAMEVVDTMNAAILEMAAESLVLKICQSHGKPGGIRAALTHELGELGRNTLKFFNEAVKNETTKETQNAEKRTEGRPSSV